MGGWTAGDTLVQTANNHMAASTYMAASPQTGTVMHPRRQVIGGKYTAARTWRQAYDGKYMAANISCGSKFMAATIWQQDHRALVSRYRQQAWARSSPSHSL